MTSSTVKQTGSPLSWLPRLLVMATAGLTVVPLAITGTTVWLTATRSRHPRAED